MISIIQANLGGGVAAQNLVLQTAAERGTDILLLGEYYKFGKHHEQWHCDLANRAAIALITTMQTDEIGSAENGFVWVTVGGVRVYSCYWSPNTSYQEYEAFIARLEVSVRSSSVPVVIGGDFNAKHSLWSSPKNDRRGEVLADMAQVLDLAICNTGSDPTREKDGYQSYIDVTLVSAVLQQRLDGWMVLQDETMSDHNYIAFSLSTTVPAPQTVTGWRARTVDQTKFLQSMADWSPDMNENAEMCARDLDAALVRAMNASTAVKSAQTRRRSVHWWTPEIGRLRKDSNHTRRVYQRRKRAGEDYEVELNTSRSARRALVKAIKKARKMPGRNYARW